MPSALAYMYMYTYFNPTCIDPLCFFSVTAEMVRLTTENDFLRQEKEKLDDSNSKMAQKAASLVCTCTCACTCKCGYM